MANPYITKPLRCPTGSVAARNSGNDRLLQSFEVRSFLMIAYSRGYCISNGNSGTLADHSHPYSEYYYSNQFVSFSKMWDAVIHTNYKTGLHLIKISQVGTMFDIRFSGQTKTIDFIDSI